MSNTAHADPNRLRRLMSRLRYWQPLQPFSNRFGSKDDYLAWFEKVPSPKLRPFTGAWRGCAVSATMAGTQSFKFFGVERTLSDNRGWHWKPWGENWLCNLHAFDDLVAEDAAARHDGHVGLITNWMVANPPGKGVGWQQDSLARRISNWIRWDLSHRKLNEVAQRNLVVQTLYLRQHLSSTPHAVYPTKVGKALLFAGAFFDSSDAEGWRKTGLGMMRDAMKDISSARSGSTRISEEAVVEDMLDVVQLSARYPGLLSPTDVSPFRSFGIDRLARLGDVSVARGAEADGPPVYFTDPSPSSLRAYAGAL